MLKIITLLSLLVIEPSFASETIKGAKKDLDSFKQDMTLELKEIEKKIEALSKKAEGKGSSVYKETVKDLDRKRDELRSTLNSLEADAKGGWKETKSKLSKSIDSLNERVQKALKD